MVELKEIARVKRVDVGSPHGIYYYNKEKNEWVLVMKDDGILEPFLGDGYYVIYFDNTRCPACRIYDLSWYSFIELFGKDYDSVNFVIVLCSWFARECDSKAASESFKKYEVRASPTTILWFVKNGEIIATERKDGSMSLDKLAKFIDGFIKKNK